MREGRYQGLAIYVISTLILYYYLDYAKILGMIPQGIHFMRQTDSLSIIIHYLKTGMHFWAPGILDLESEGGKTASEFPIIYYFIAFLYQLTGEHEWYLRAINLMLCFTGFYFFFEFLKTKTNTVVAMGGVFLLTGSLLLYYYMNNFIPDVAALGFSLSGLFIYLKHEYEDSKKELIGLSFMLFACLIKVSFFIYPASVFIVRIMTEIKNRDNSLVDAVKKNKILLIVFALGTLSLLAWIMYIRQYNRSHNGYFLVKSMSIFKADAEDRQNVFNNVTGWWATTYYPTITKYYLALIYIIGLALPNKKYNTLKNLSLLSILGSVGFFLLFFLQFQNHDYYFIAFIPCIALCFIFAYLEVSNRFVGRLLPTLMLGILIFIAYDGVIGSKKQLWERYRTSFNDLYSITGQIFSGADKVLDQHGISRDAKIIVIRDRNVNASLYFMKRFGWPIMDTTSRYTSMIPKCINEGATHIVITDTNYLSHPTIHPLLGELAINQPGFKLYTINKSK